MAQRVPTGPSAALERAYQVRCPDVLEVQVEGHPGASGPCEVATDGRIHLGEMGNLRVDGLTTPEIARSVAHHLDVATETVRVRVTGFHSQELFLFGEVAGLQRAVAYQGPETVLDLLQRVGGINPGAAPEDIQVVRAHVADGKAPEVFHVDLAAILHKNDPRTNVLLQPFDQVYVGQSRTSKLTPCLPPWVRPFYKGLCGIN